MLLIKSLVTLFALSASSSHSLQPLISTTPRSRPIINSKKTELEVCQAGYWQEWPHLNGYTPSYNVPYCINNTEVPADTWIPTNRMRNGNPTWTEFYLYDHNRVLIGIDTHVLYWNGADGMHLPHSANCLLGPTLGSFKSA
jgi:hypothetical protein